MENLRISGDDDSPEGSRTPGRSLGRGRNTRPTNQTSARDIQLQNQFQREVREEEQQRARIEARSRANQHRLTTQFQREQDASARYGNSHVPMSARDLQLQNQYRQELREAERQRARQEAHTAAQQQRLNAQYQRELAEEQRHAARAHNMQTGTVPKTAGTSTEPTPQSARGIQNQYRCEYEDQRRRAQAAIQQQRERSNAHIRRAEDQLSHARRLAQHAEAQRNQYVRAAHMAHLGPRMTQDCPLSQAQIIAAQRSGPTIRLHAAFTMHTPNPTEQCPIAVVQPVVYTPTPFYSYLASSVHPTPINFQQFQEVDRNNEEEEWEEEEETPEGWGAARARNVNPSANVGRDEVNRNNVEEEWSEGEENAGGWGAAAVIHHVNPSANVGREEEDDGDAWPEGTENEARGRAPPPLRMDPEMVAEILAVTAAARAAAAYESTPEYLPAGAEDNWSDEETPGSAASTTEEEAAGDTEAPTQQGSLGMCLVCLHRPRSTMFLDCGHISCCQKCSSSLRTCPTCRAVIKKVQRAYLP